MPVKRRDSEAGFTMISVVLGVTLVIALSVVAVTAVRGDLGSNRYDLNQKRAYEAAKAGVNDYVFHLHDETDYWAKCTNVTPATNAVNQVGSTAKRRPVPGNTGGTYAIELLPASGQTTYTQCDPANPGPSMLESSGMLKGTFRIRSTGYSGGAEVSIVATFKPATFLDYVYFTQRETTDPVAYGYALGTPQRTGVDGQCSKSFEEGRMNAEIPNLSKTYCVVISFGKGDVINGPMHTNDAFVYCENPTLGRSPTDPIEVSGPDPGWYETRDIINSGSGCASTNVNVKGTFFPDSPVINPPPSNAALQTIAGLKFAGQVRICLSGNNMTASYGKSCTATPLAYSGTFPANGVIYVENVECDPGYSPFTVTYPETSKCGNAYIRGEYSGQLTVAAANDIIIDGHLKHSGEGVLGLVANQFVRVFHPYPSQTATSCGSGGHGTGTIESLRIDAAILAIDHSFIVDHYNCGSNLKKLTVNGAIAMKYRGPVGTQAGNGYIKDYNYDDRLRYMQPPSFIQPAESDWVVGRMTIE